MTHIPSFNFCAFMGKFLNWLDCSIDAKATYIFYAYKLDWLNALSQLIFSRVTNSRFSSTPSKCLHMVTIKHRHKTQKAIRKMPMHPRNVPPSACTFSSKKRRGKRLSQHWENGPREWSLTWHRQLAGKFKQSTPCRNLVVLILDQFVHPSDTLLWRHKAVIV